MPACQPASRTSPILVLTVVELSKIIIFHLNASLSLSNFISFACLDSFTKLVFCFLFITTISCIGLDCSTSATALCVLAKGACPYMPTLYVLYLTMSPLIALACLVFNIIAVLYIKYRHLLSN